MSSTPSLLSSAAANSRHVAFVRMFPTLAILAFYLLATSATALRQLPKLSKDQDQLFTSSSRSYSQGFKTEPIFKVEDFNVQRVLKDRSQLADGYFFIDPMWRHKGWGPQIYTIDGMLIWKGSGAHRSQNLHVCDYKNTTGTHLCYYHNYHMDRFPKGSLPIPKSEKPPKTMYGKLKVLDNTYKVVEDWSRAFKGLSFNGHAFEMTPGGNTFTTLAARPRMMDLTPYFGPKDGWIRNQCITEMSVDGPEELFHWCYIEGGLEVWETFTFFNSPKQHVNTTGAKFGSGTRDGSWDFLHMNAVSKNSDGDYYVSVRHCDTIVKVAGNSNPEGHKPGTTLWRLGGKSNDFKMLKFDTPEGFTRPHDVRSISVDGNEEVISLFNNAWDGATPPSQKHSDAQFIRLDTKKWEATLMINYPHPRGGLTQGRGNVQTLPNGNILVGWGWLPSMTEFDKNGTVLYHASYSQHLRNREFSYRVWKGPWVGRPHWSPKLVAYSRSCNMKSSTRSDSGSPLVAYVSWNGATEVDKWQFHLASKRTGPWIPAGHVQKDDFETKAYPKTSIELPGFMPWVSAQALDVDGKVIGDVVSQVFVPTGKYRSECDEEGCEKGFVYDEEKSKAAFCETSDAPALIALFFFALFIQAIMYLMDRTMYMAAGRSSHPRIEYEAVEKQGS